MIGNGARPRTGGAKGPRSRMCYVCGRQTLLAGYDWHVTQCKDLFIKREELKPKRERRPVPEDPMISFQASGQGGGGVIPQDQLDAYNHHAEQAYQATLAACQFCGRTFEPDKLRIHNRSCTADHPAKSVNRTAAAALPAANITGPSKHATMPHQPAGGGSGFPNITERPDSNQGARTTGSLFAKPMKQKSMNNVRFKEEDGGGGAPTPGKPIQPAPVDYSAFEDYEKNFVPACMIKCPDCGRQFNEQAYSHHANICKKVFGQQRKVFDSSKKRVEGTDMETIKPKKPSTGKGTLKRPGSVRNMTGAMAGSEGIGADGMPKAQGSNWKNQSVAFRDAIKAARQISIAERHAKSAGVPLSSILPPANIRSPDDPAYSDYVQCPHCGRKYNQTAGARHIPQCKNIFAKPARLKKGTGHSAVPVRG